MAEEKNALLAAKLEDGLRLSEKRPFYLGFLDEAESYFCESFLKRRAGTSFLFWGGHEEAERKILGLFPEYLSPSPEEFPLSALTFRYRREDSLSHRDFLGAFMALGIERDVVGDILAEEGRCVAFLREEMVPYFCANLKKIGRVGVKLSPGAELPLPIGRKYLELSGVIASPRLDCLTAFLCRTSREKAAKLIASGSVALHYREILSGSTQVEEGNKLSIRGYGKFIIDQLGPFTSKGRLIVKCRKYQ